MNLLDEKIRGQLQEAFHELKGDVAIIFFGTNSQDCEYCGQTQALLEELTGLDEKLHLEILDLENDANRAAAYNVDKAPAIVLASLKENTITDYGIRFAGIPAGHEFSSLIRSVLMVSQGDSGLEKDTRLAIAGLEKSVNLQVFVTPTCPYCPQAVVLAHQMALESPNIQAEMVEATEFPELASQYGVGGVPHTTINFGADELVGAAPEKILLQKIMAAVKNN